jgi:hypothetical protein
LEGNGAEDSAGKNRSGLGIGQSPERALLGWPCTWTPRGPYTARRSLLAVKEEVAPGLWGVRAYMSWVVGAARLETRTEEFPLLASPSSFRRAWAHLTRCWLSRGGAKALPVFGQGVQHHPACRALSSHSRQGNTRKPVSFTTGSRRVRKQTWRAECSADVQIACLTEVKGRKTHRTG